MKKVLLTGTTGTVAHVMRQELGDEYDISGISIARMDEILERDQPIVWKEQLDAYNERVMEQVTEAARGQDAIVHLGWNTRDENWQKGLDPLNIAITDCVYRVAIAERIPRIYMTSSVHSFDFMGDDYDREESIPNTPDTRRDLFGVGSTSLYGISKRWMEIAGQYYTKRLQEGQKILVVRLGGVGRSDRPYRADGVWDSHRDCAGLLRAFIECEEDAPNFYIAYGVSDNHDEDQKPIFDWRNPYGFKPEDNAYLLTEE